MNVQNQSVLLEEQYEVSRMLLIVQQDVFLHCCCQKFGVFCLGFTSLHLHVIYFPS